jgi:hypothetical protein
MSPENKKESKIDDVPSPESTGEIGKDSNSFKMSSEDPKIETKDDGKIDPEIGNIPTDKKKDMELAEDIERFTSYFNQVIEYEKRSVSLPLHVDELASKVAKFYESVRRIIDWKEEHLIRRVAIERILKRSLISEISGIQLISGLNPNRLAEPLILELIRGGYFQNDSVPKSKIFEVQVLLRKYIYLLKNNNLARDVTSLDIKTKVEFYNWLLSIAACELEELLDPPLRETGLINLMTTAIYRGVKVDDSEKLNKEEIYLQAYIAVHKTLFNLDSPIISYRVIRYKYPDLFEKPEETLPKFAEDIINIWNQIKDDLVSPLGRELFRVCERYDVVYRIIGDIYNKNEDSPSLIRKRIVNPIELDRMVTEEYNARIKTLKTRLFRSAIFSTLSIFLAGSVSLFIVEVPLAKLFFGSFSPLAMFVDIMIPTVLMFILVAIIRPPKKSNREKVISEVRKVIYKEYEKNIYEITMRKKNRWLMNLIFIFLYLVGGIGSLIFIFWVFKLVNVPWTSLYIDTANIAVIVSAALIIRAKSKEITIEEEGGFLEFLTDFFTIPLAKIGQWLSEKWKEYNFVSVFFIALIDSPISSFITLIEEWRGFIKERKSEIR